jgi:predicted secreted protein
MLIHFLPFIVVICVFASYWAGIKYRRHMSHIRHTDCQHFVLNESQHGTVVTVPPNSGIVLTLKDNPSTGYQWHMVESTSSILTLMNNGQHTPLEVANPIDQQRIGGGGTMLWRFWANNLGIETIKLHYRRPWDPLDKPHYEYNVTIAVVAETKPSMVKATRLKIC